MDLGDTYYGMNGDYEDKQIEHVPEEDNPTNIQDTPIDATGSGNTVASTATQKKKNNISDLGTFFDSMAIWV